MLDIMRTNVILRILLIIVFLACILLSFVDNPNTSDLYKTCNVCLIIAGLISGFLTFNRIYGKDYLIPAFLLIFIKYVGGSTVLTTISLHGFNLEQSFTGLYNFIVALTIVSCCKELFLLFK